MQDREIERWITVNGKHIPIYADEPDDSKRKEHQIKQNEEEATKKNQPLTTQSDVDDMLMEMSDDDFKKQKSLGAVGSKYFGNDFGRELNRFLTDNERMKYIYERPDFQGAIEQLDNAMVELPRNVRVERYVDERTLPGFDYKNPSKMVGKTIDTPGYLSTTIDAKNSKFEFSNYPAVIVLDAQKGTKALLDANKKEAEILFHRKSKYQIVSFDVRVDKTGQKQIVYYARMETKQ